MNGQQIVATKATQIVGGRGRIPPGTALTIVRMLPRHTVVGETKNGRWVILDPQQYVTA